MGDDNIGITGTDQIEVRGLTAELNSEWQEFLATSNNGTLFHDLEFLAYHPSTRFETHHLIFVHRRQIIGVLPACVRDDGAGNRIFVSPSGASIGGIVTRVGMSGRGVIDLVKALRDYLVANGVVRAEIRIGPSEYLAQPNQNIEFALSINGFRLTGTCLCHMIPLQLLEVADGISSLATKKKRYDIRNALKRGAQPREASKSELQEFYRILTATFDRHQATPTHTCPELQTLIRLVPDRIRIFLCCYNDVNVAGVLVFVLNPRVAYTMYICNTRESLATAAAAALLNHISLKLAAEGFVYLDLGPSSAGDSYNDGVAFFKEGLGGRGYCRTTWELNSKKDDV